MLKYNAEGLIFPRISNQRYNSYLKEIAVIIGVEKKLTTHIARKTFASTVLNNPQVSSASSPPHNLVARYGLSTNGVLLPCVYRIKKPPNFLSGFSFLLLLLDS